MRSRSRSGIKLGSSLIMDIPVVLRGLEDIASRYDVILFDQFGVLHDGRTLFPGVLETLKQLKSMNKTLGVVSNTSRRSAEAIKSITKLGIPTDTFDSFVTSGELAYNHLSEEYSNKDASCTVLTWKGYQLSYLTTLGIKLAPPEAATFVYLHGSESMQVSEHSSQSTPLDLINTGVLDASVETMLRVALRRQLPLLCANSDHTAVTDGRLLYMPGLVAERYEQMGGTVLHFGKPYAPVFDTAIDQCLSIHAERKMEKRDDQTVPQKVSPDVLRLKDQAPSNPMADRIRDIARRRARSRILHVGDSLTHDILGMHSTLIYIYLFGYKFTYEKKNGHL